MIVVDGFRCRRDGTIDVDAAGRRYTLRQIKLGEYFALRADVDVLAGKLEDPEPWIVAWSVRAVAMLSGWLISDPPAWFANPDLPVRMIDHWRAWPIPLFEKAKPEPTDPRQRMRQRSTAKPALRTWGPYAEIAPIYEALANRGIGGDYDAIPLWKVAAMLGAHNPPENERGNANDWLARGSLNRGDATDDGKPVGPSARKSQGRSTPTEGSLAPLDPTEAIRRRIEAAEAGKAAPKWSEEEMAVGFGDLTQTLSRG